MYCPKCGSFNSNNKFCIKCGASLTFNNPISNISNVKKKSILPIIISICTLIIFILLSVLIANKLIVKNDSDQLKANEHFSCGMDVIVSVNDDGTVNCEGKEAKYYNLSEWKDIKAVAAGDGIIIGLKNDGEVIAVSDNRDELLQSFENDISKWKNICSISFELSSGLLAGVKTDGTVVITGCYDDVDVPFSSLDVSSLKDVAEVSIGVFYGEYPYILALKNNGTVEKIIGSIDGTENVDTDVIELFNAMIDVSEFKNIKYIYTNTYNVFGITKSGELKMTNYLYVDEKDIFDQMNPFIQKMCEDMLKRTQQYNISQILSSPHYDLKSVPLPYYKGDYYFNEIYLLLNDGTVVTESPYLSLYYYAKDLSGDDLYNKVQEYMNYNCDYDDFFNSWYEYCYACEKLINETSSLRNIIAIDTYIDSEQEDEYSLIVMSENGEICAADKFPDLSDWGNAKTNEKSQKSIISQINSTTESIETTSKMKTETTTAKTTKSKDENFYKDKYYLYADDSGELNIEAFEIVDDYIIRVTYFEPPNFSQYTFVDAYYADREGNYLYNKDMGFEFFIDVESQKVKYKASNSSDFETLKEVDSLNKKNLEKFAKKYS